MKVYLRLVQFLKPYYRFLVPYSITTLIYVVLDIANLAMIIPMLDVLFDNAPTDTSQQSLPEFSLSISYFTETFTFYLARFIEQEGKVEALFYICLFIIVTSVLKNLSYYANLLSLASGRRRLIRNFRLFAYKQIFTKDLAYFNKNRKGDILSRLTADIQEVEMGVLNSANVVLREPVKITAYFITLFFISPQLTLITITVIPLAGSLVAQLTRKLRKNTGAMQAMLGSVTTHLEESLYGIKVVKAFTAEKKQYDRLGSQVRDYGNTFYKVALKQDLASPLSEMLGVSMITAILYFGGKLVLDEGPDLSASQFMFFIIVLSQILVPVKSLTRAIANLQRSLSAGDRIFEVVDSEPELKDGPISEAPVLKQSLEFKDVRFSYNADQEILKGINFKLEKGTMTALVGPSGGGKSTISDLTARFYDPDNGQILIDGIDISQYKQTDYRDLLGIVTQESILFNDTIAYNIGFGAKESTLEEVIAAAKVANAHEFITQLPEGYNTMVGDSGLRLSGGQRQRVCIARAVLRNPRLLILDEATSALDTESERLVQDALAHLLKSRTSLVIAHRLSTIQQADQILVVDQGKIKERGTHAELLQIKDGIYRKLSEMQDLGVE